MNLISSNLDNTSPSVSSVLPLTNCVGFVRNLNIYIICTIQPYIIFKSIFKNIKIKNIIRNIIIFLIFATEQIILALLVLRDVTDIECSENPPMGLLYG